MKELAKLFFWLGIIFIPVSWIFWFLEPDLGGTVYENISDPGVRDAMESAASQRMAIFVGLWPPTLFILSNLIHKREAREQVDKVV